MRNCHIQCQLSDLCTLCSSKRVFADDYVDNGIPFYRGGEITLKQKGQPVNDPLFISDAHFKELKEKYGAPIKDDILITAVGTIGNSYLVDRENFYFKDGNIIWLKDFSKYEYRFFIYDFMQSSLFQSSLEAISIGSTQTALTIAALSDIKVLVPIFDKLKSYAKQSSMIRKNIQQNNMELEELHHMSEFILSSLNR
ncbi:restriction endonuclease subunit S [Anaerovibrio sp. JC8]|uniref:restriction endonuclease subunit S n=1 Tax=Anaerovibrio sp. JC8 TaxID=1240085 RepID=UPI000A117DD2|nr:restriction endonuclease subunit S [Anaerovibrio sp. JC8]